MKFRELITKAGTKILAGKNAQNNEELVKQAKTNEEVFHTKKPGSPFVNIKCKPKKGDIKQAAIFCSVYSRDWRDNKKDVIVHRFKKKDIYKIKTMPSGTFGIKKHKTIKAKKFEIIRFKNKLKSNKNGIYRI